MEWGEAMWRCGGCNPRKKKEDPLMNPHSRPPPSPVGLPPIWGEPDMVSEEGSHAQRRRYMVMNQKEAHINVAPPCANIRRPRLVRQLFSPTTRTDTADVHRSVSGSVAAAMASSGCTQWPSGGQGGSHAAPGIVPCLLPEMGPRTPLAGNVRVGGTMATHAARWTVWVCGQARGGRS